MLRLTKAGKRKYISLHLSFAPQFWTAAKSRPRRHYPGREKIVALIERKIREYEKQIVDFKTNERSDTLHMCRMSTIRALLFSFQIVFVEADRDFHRLPVSDDIQFSRKTFLDFNCIIER